MTTNQEGRNLVTKKCILKKIRHLFLDFDIFLLKVLIFHIDKNNSFKLLEELEDNNVIF
jgi:hypothetical protein